MAWSTPKDWANTDVLNTTNLNLYVRDQQEYLFSRPYDLVYLSENAWTTTSTTFVAVDASEFVVEAEIAPGAMWEIGFYFPCYNDTNAYFLYFDWYNPTSGYYLSDYPGYTGAGKAAGVWYERWTDSRTRTKTHVMYNDVLDGILNFELHWRVNAGIGGIDTTAMQGQLWMREV